MYISFLVVLLRSKIVSLLKNTVKTAFSFIDFYFNFTIIDFCCISFYVVLLLLCDCLMSENLIS